MAQIPPLGRGEVAVQSSEATVLGSEVAVQGGEAPTSQSISMKTSATGCCGKVGLLVGHNGAWPAYRSHANR